VLATVVLTSFRCARAGVFQEVFGTEPDDLRWVVRDKIDVCEGLIPIAFLCCSSKTRP
jgi:hypothetical protein